MTGEMIERVARAIFADDAQWDRMKSTPLHSEFKAKARAAIEAMREPTEAIGAAMLLARTYFDQPDENQRLTQAEADVIGINDNLAGNPSRWCMPDWRAGIDAALSGKPPEVTRK
jgi:hypothetical protein